MSDEHHVVEHAHPSAGTYVKIAIVLGLITAGEVAIYYIGALQHILGFLLISLSAVKFGIVAGFYMHLKFDHWLFTCFFVGGLGLAATIVMVFMTLFGIWARVPPV